MTDRFRRACGWLHRRAENVAALMLAVMFTAFIVQVIFRYLLNFPIGGASELTIIMWLWVVLWGAAFVLREEEEIRFDILYELAGPRLKRAMTVLAALVVIALYGISMPAAWSYVTFMKVQKSPYLGIRFDYLYAIYILFAAAVIVRYIVILANGLRGRSTRGGVTELVNEGKTEGDQP